MIMRVLSIFREVLQLIEPTINLKMRSKVPYKSKP